MSVFTNSVDAAPDAASAYIEATLSLLEGRDPVDVLGSTPDEFATLIGDVPPALLRRPEAPGRWSVGEVLAHLADSDLMWGVRLRMVLGHDRPTLLGYDQDAWARAADYASIEPRTSLVRFATVRSWNLALLDGLDDTARRRVGVHAERGEESVTHMIRLYAGHDLVHLAQARRVLAAAEAP